LNFQQERATFTSQELFWRLDVHSLIFLSAAVVQSLKQEHICFLSIKLHLATIMGMWVCNKPPHSEDKTPERLKMFKTYDSSQNIITPFVCSKSNQTK